MSRFEWGYLYGRKWRVAKGKFIAKHPICRMCLDAGRTEPARVVDHVVPHKGNAALFWDRSNWQALCFNCHNQHKQRQERLDELAANACRIDGYPVNSEW